MSMKKKCFVRLFNHLTNKTVRLAFSHLKTRCTFLTVYYDECSAQFVKSVIIDKESICIRLQPSVLEEPHKVVAFRAEKIQDHLFVFTVSLEPLKNPGHSVSGRVWPWTRQIDVCHVDNNATIIIDLHQNALDIAKRPDAYKYLL